MSRLHYLLIVGPGINQLTTLIIFLAILVFELRPLHFLDRLSKTWATLPALFWVGYFQDRVLQTICLGWPWTAIFLISASFAWATRAQKWTTLCYISHT
jgi:hypothetical protein